MYIFKKITLFLFNIKYLCVYVQIFNLVIIQEVQKATYMTRYPTLK